jgi:hypothetical protein
MKYILLIYGDEKAFATMPKEEQEKIFGAYMGFSEELKGAGKMVAGDALEGVHTATTVRVRNGKTTHTDGPFADTKEQLGGYYVIDAKDLNDAIAWAAKIPGAHEGSIEIRPLVVFE